MTAERERTLRRRVYWVFVLIALSAIGLFTLQVALLWPTWIEMLVFMVVYGVMYRLGEMWIFRKSDD